MQQQQRKHSTRTMCIMYGFMEGVFFYICSCIQPTKHNAIIRTDVVSVATRGVLCALAMYYSIIL